MVENKSKFRLAKVSQNGLQSREMLFELFKWLCKDIVVPIGKFLLNAEGIAKKLENKGALRFKCTYGTLVLYSLVIPLLSNS